VHDRRSQETRNKQTHQQPRKGSSTALLPQDPTVCQTLNHAITPPPFQNHHWLVLRQGNNTTGRYLLIFHP
jgi:hypothetical protein